MPKRRGNDAAHCPQQRVSEVPSARLTTARRLHDGSQILQAPSRRSQPPTDPNGPRRRRRLWPLVPSPRHRPDQRWQVLRIPSPILKIFPIVIELHHHRDDPRAPANALAPLPAIVQTMSMRRRATSLQSTTSWHVRVSWPPRAPPTASSGSARYSRVGKSGIFLDALGDVDQRNGETPGLRLLDDEDTLFNCACT